MKSRERADPSRFDAAEKKKLEDRVVGQKQGELYQKWIEALRKRAKIVENEQVLSYETATGHEQVQPDDF